MIPGAAFAANRMRASRLTAVHPVIRLGGLVLGLASCLLAGPWVLAAMLPVLSMGLAATGLGLGSQLRSVRPWLPMVAVILLIHILTTTAAAPLGTPTWAGLLAGARALLRVSCTVGWLALYTRASSLDDLMGSVRWWLRPLEKVGFPGENLGLVLAVALGTAPVVLGEGRRIETVLRLRRGGTKAGRWKRFWTRQLDRARVVVPLMESLGRRTEALSLSLRSRRPDTGRFLRRRPPLAGLVILGAWLLVLIALGLLSGRTP